jgi:thiol-disulfide isomerase/thioredoxin
MKKLSILLMLVALGFSGARAQVPASGSTQASTQGSAEMAWGHFTINGTWNKATTRAMKLYNVSNGVIHEIASTTLSEGNRFSFQYVPESPDSAGGEFYVVATSQPGRADCHTFWLKASDELNVVFNADNTYTLTGDNSRENKEMARWHQFMAPIEDKAIYFQGKQSTWVDFFPLLNEKVAAAAKWKPKETRNPRFDEAFGYYREFDMAYDALNFMATPRSAYPKSEDLPAYYRDVVTLPRLTASEKLMDFPFGMDLISRYGVVMFTYLPEVKAGMMGQEKSFVPMQMLPHIANDVIRGEETIFLARSLKTHVALKDYESKYSQYLVTQSQKERFQAILDRVAANNSGQQPAIDFKFADRDGKEIALSDLKGKVVYIDVWATWCGPCRREFPFMKTLEAEYHGNDGIVFMGVSVDASRDKQKWMDFLTKEQLPGLQIFAGDAANDAIMRPYRIGGIPRFILVGRDGNLISADAPRPSSNEIRTVLNSAIGK